MMIPRRERSDEAAREVTDDYKARIKDLDDALKTLTGSFGETYPLTPKPTIEEIYGSYAGLVRARDWSRDHMPIGCNGWCYVTAAFEYVREKLHPLVVDHSTGIITVHYDGTVSGLIERLKKFGLEVVQKTPQPNDTVTVP